MFQSSHSWGMLPVGTQGRVKIMRITPRIGTSVRTPLGSVYLGASIRSGQRSTPRRTPITAGPMARPQRPAKMVRPVDPRTLATRPTPAVTIVRPVVVQAAPFHPTEAAYRLASLAMLLGTGLALVAMAFVAMALGIIPTATQHASTPLVSVVSVHTEHSASHPLIPRNR